MIIQYPFHLPVFFTGQYNEANKQVDIKWDRGLVGLVPNFYYPKLLVLLAGVLSCLDTCSGGFI